MSHLYSSLSDSSLKLLGLSINLTLGKFFCHFSSCLVLSRAIKLGAFGAGMLMCPSSTPLLVITNRVSLTSNGEEVARLCGKTPSSFIMS